MHDKVVPAIGLSILAAGVLEELEEDAGKIISPYTCNAFIITSFNVYTLCNVIYFITN